MNLYKQNIGDVLVVNSKNYVLMIPDSKRKRK